MNTFTLEVWDDEGSMCTFYTVKWDKDDDDAESETDKFFNEYAVPGHLLADEAFQLSRLIIENIGNKFGATNDFFDRTEEKAEALPPRPKHWVKEIKVLGKSFPLRLFCYRVSEKIVVLFNGGIKDAPTIQECKNLSMQFYEAQTFVKKIEEAIRLGIIEISNDGRYLKDFNGAQEITL